jgi:hypothetical protein
VRVSNIVAIATLAVAVAVPAIASATTAKYRSGSALKFELFFDAKLKRGHPSKLVNFGWNDLPCKGGGIPYTGTLSDPVKVRKGSFEATEHYVMEGEGFTVTIKGEFVKDDAKAVGTIVSKGFCESGKQKWSATNISR